MTKENNIIILLLTVCLLLWNCKSENKTPNIDSSEDVFYEIFPQLVNHIYKDRRVIPIPPPPPDILEKKGYNVKGNLKKAYNRWEKSEENEKIIKEWNRKKDSIEKDTTSIYLSVPDYVSITEKNDSILLIKHFFDKKIHVDLSSNFENKNFKIDLKRLKSNNPKLKFKYLSKFPKGKDLWNKNYDFLYHGSLNFTKIIFDKTNQYGVLNIGIAQGKLNGYGCRVFIKVNEQNKWVIDKIENTWVS